MDNVYIFSFENCWGRLTIENIVKPAICGTIDGF